MALHGGKKKAGQGAQLSDTNSLLIRSLESAIVWLRLRVRAGKIIDNLSVNNQHSAETQSRLRPSADRTPKLVNRGWN